MEPAAKSEPDADWHTDDVAWQDLRDERDAGHRVESGVGIGDGRERRFGQPDESQRGSKLLFRQSLVVQHHRERGTGNRRHCIEHAQPASEAEPHRPLSADRPPIPSGLKQDQRQQDDERVEAQARRADTRHDERSNHDAGDEAEHDRQHASPHAGQGTTIDPEYVGVERDLDQHHRRVENAVGQEQERERDRDRREPVPECAVDDRGEQRDGGKRDRVGRH